MDKPFIEFAFPATGAPTLRTMPERLAEVINVKDWGATGLGGGNNDEAAVQAAIDEAIRRGGGKIFFPQGSYAISGPNGYLNVGSDDPAIRVDLISYSTETNVLSGSSASTPIISKGSAQYDNIGRVEGFTFYAAQGPDAIIKLEGNNQSVRNVYLDIQAGKCGIDAASATGAFISEVKGQGNGGNPANVQPPGSQPGTVGIYLGDSCACYNCRLQGGLYIVYALSGICPAVIASSEEVAHIGIRVGWAPPSVGNPDGTEETAYGFVIAGFQTEQTDTPIELYNCQGGLVAGLELNGAVGEVTPAAISSVIWTAPNTVTVTTTQNHNLPAGNYVLQIEGNIGLIPLLYPTYGTYTPPGFHILAVVGGVADQFTYWHQSAVDPGGNYTGAGLTWAQTQMYSIRFRKVNGVALMGCDANQKSTLAGFDFDFDGEAENHSNNVMYSCNNPCGARLPQAGNLNKNTILAGWSFFGTGATQNQLDGYGWRSSDYTVGSPAGRMVFADLPGQGGYQPGPMLGQEFDIIDSPTANIGNFGAVVAVGGDNKKVRLRWDGADWVITG